MDKKRQIVFSSNKAQVTVFIIMGIILLFVFIAIIAFTSQLQKEEFSAAEEQAFNQMFEKEALRIFVEDCLRDSLQDGLIIVGEQGKIWEGQPGGVTTFVEGVNGMKLADGTQVAYALENKKYPQHQNAYPCKNDTSSPEFCRYEFPDTSLGFGELTLRASSITNDLQRFLGTKTQECVETYTKENISSKAKIESTDVDIKLSLLNDGIAVKANYPLKFSLDNQDFFHLSSFDFFYSTQFKQLLDAAVLIPLERDFRYLDFEFTEETLKKPTFTYANKQQFSSCDPFQNNPFLFFCQQGLNADQYNNLGISLTKSSFGGDDLFTFTPSSSLIVNRPGDYHFNVLRQNRPPALDYIERFSCPLSDYDYLVVKDDPKLGTVEFTPFAKDPDEDSKEFKFVNGVFKFEESNGTVKVSAEDLKDLEGVNMFSIKSIDEHGLEDVQDVRVLIDRPLQTNLQVDYPYNFTQNYSSYKEYLGNNDILLISREDPVFINISTPGTSLKGAVPSVQLIFEGNNEKFTSLIPLNLKDACFAFPSSLGKKSLCDLDSYKSMFNEWDKLLAKSDLAFKNPTPTGKLFLNTTTNYCSEQEVSSMKEINVAIVACLSHRNPTHPYPYVRDDPNEYYKYKFPVGEDGTDFSKNVGKEDINPFMASNICCASNKIQTAGATCFINPEPGCYGRVKDFTISINSKKNNPSGFSGYVKETQVATCDGVRGNICGGEKEYKLEYNQLTCGNSSLTGCQTIASACQNQPAYGYPQKDGEAIGWCYGTMGCQSLCPSGSEVVDLTAVTTPSKAYDANIVAKTKLITNSKDLNLGCGCNSQTEAKACDGNFDGIFAGQCRGGKCDEAKG
ncbi:hypothetical protein HQ489_01735 [Candidatus Woesearchaeota archaeon]|nr:hypothetical protein [Candidatus Woesearchaeota archaeon]